MGITTPYRTHRRTNRGAFDFPFYDTMVSTVSSSWEPRLNQQNLIFSEPYHPPIILVTYLSILFPFSFFLSATSTYLYLYPSIKAMDAT